jgi:hypothetical protein
MLDGKLLSTHCRECRRTLDVEASLRSFTSLVASVRHWAPDGSTGVSCKVIGSETCTEAAVSNRPGP